MNYIPEKDTYTISLSDKFVRNNTIYIKSTQKSNLYKTRTVLSHSSFASHVNDINLDTYLAWVNIWYTTSFTRNHQSHFPLKLTTIFWVQFLSISATVVATCHHNLYFCLLSMRCLVTGNNMRWQILFFLHISRSIITVYWKHCENNKSRILCRLFTLRNHGWIWKSFVGKWHRNIKSTLNNGNARL